jgi:hypothetical protein
MNKQTLTALLLNAEAAHKAHEMALGHPDPQWAPFYADYILKNLPVKRIGQDDIFGDSPRLQPLAAQLESEFLTSRDM